MTVIGFDIGGVNTKAARTAAGAVAGVASRPYELQRDPQALRGVLRALAQELGEPAPSDCAVTMTAELSQMFRTKRDGVAFVLDAIEAAFPDARHHVYTVEGRFVTPADGRTMPHTVAAANWHATAAVLARHHPDALLIDIGTTTTDIIPIVNGRVCAEGTTDPARLATGELVYTGALRTPAEAIASAVPLGGGLAGVAAEAFALAGDVHVWRGDLDPADYTVEAPDGRPASRVFAGERLARVVCGDRDLLDEAAITAIADALAAAQANRVADAVRRVCRRHPSIRVAVVTGLGAFLGARAARSEGLGLEPLAAVLGASAARCAPAACVALLLEQALGRRIQLVVKLGGGLLRHPDAYRMALDLIAAVARERAVLVVPGGGPFADAVRNVDRAIGVSDEAAHWMAVLGMDQLAHLIASHVRGGRVVEDVRAIGAALAADRVPVLAPSRWLRTADPLPHSWDVTSDSIAAWIAGEIGARELVLVKPPHATGELVDAFFARALRSGVAAAAVPVDQLENVFASKSAG